ncbi:MAG: hypothetical protein M3P01_11070 [Actinomycetota bacterium]|nr:hypothetical protein [Actinomycetota bacterium]
MDGPPLGVIRRSGARETDLPGEGGERNQGLIGDECVRSPRPSPHTNFESQVDGFPSEEGGLHKGPHTLLQQLPAGPSARPTLPATAHLPGGIEMVMAGGATSR